MFPVMAALTWVHVLIFHLRNYIKMVNNRIEFHSSELCICIIMKLLHTCMQIYLISW